MTGREEILGFIGNFRGSEDVFLNGCCYWFAHILKARFGGRILYDPIDGHFVCRIGGKCYDVTGETEPACGEGRLIDWETYGTKEPRHHERILHDCVLKDGLPSGMDGGER